MDYAKFLSLLTLLLVTTACSHTIDFRGSYFAIPIVQNESMQGYISGSGSRPTEVTLVSDRSSNPPGRSIAINSDTSSAEDFFESVFALNLIGIEGGLALFPQFEIYTYSFHTFGLKYQFIGDAKEGKGFVASLQGGYGSFKDSSSASSGSGSDEAVSEVKTVQYGGSLGYKFGKGVFYISHLLNSHSVDTDVTNTSGTFGTYKDNGVHTTSSIGVSTFTKGFLASIEYTITNAKWDPSIDVAPAHSGAEDTHDGAGVRLGLTW